MAMNSIEVSYVVCSYLVEEKELDGLGFGHARWARPLEPNI
jgi:hypothetical protein